MDLARRLLQNRNFILIISLVAGLAWGEAAKWVEKLVLPALAVVMTLSVMDITRQSLSSARTVMGPFLAGIVMNYLVLTGATLGLTSLLLRDEAFRTGFILMAAVPPAVAVVPFTLFLRGDLGFALIGSVGGYLGGLVLMPLISIGLIVAGFVKPLTLGIIIVELILAPLVVSRILLRLGLAPHLQRVKGPVVNWSFFLITYIIVGLNRDVLLGDPLSLGPVFLIAFATTILLGALIEAAAKLLGLSRDIIVPLVLLGTLKNYGLAGGLALSLFDKPSAVPATVASVFMIVYIIYLELMMKWRRPFPDAARPAEASLDP
jgi:bile acid:Na+ symporter, BASS family